MFSHQKQMMQEPEWTKKGSVMLKYQKVLLFLYSYILCVAFFCHFLHLWEYLSPTQHTDASYESGFYTY